MTKPIKATVLISKGRSGTNFLISKLLQTEKVNFGWEPFNDNTRNFVAYNPRKGRPIPKSVMEKMNDRDFRDNDQEGYIDYCAGFTGALDGTGIEVSGFKIFPRHNVDLCWKMTKDPRFDPIVLERRSVLSVYSSLHIAQKTRKWTLQKSVDEATQGKEQIQIEFKQDEFEAFHKDYVEFFQKVEENMRQNNIRFYKSHYEDLVKDPNEFVRILDFLGLDSSSQKDSPLAVQNSVNVLDRFENPEAARPYFEKENEAMSESL